MISLVESFFADLINFGKFTKSNTYKLTEEQANSGNDRINRKNILIKDEDIDTEKNYYGTK